MSRHRLAALARLLEAARQRYVERGEVSGNLRLPAITEEERLALAGLLSGYVKVRPGETLTLPLATLDQALRERGIAPGLPDAIATFTDGPLETRAEQRTALELRWDAVMQHVADLAARRGARSAPWLESLARREGVAFAILQREFNQEERSGHRDHQRLRQALTTVALALDSLPVDSARVARLPVFAREMAGDPHAFDEKPLPGRLLIRALTDLFGARCGVTEPPAGALERGILLGAAGLLSDGISSAVACYRIEAVVRTDGTTDPLVSAAAQEGAVFIASLRQVTRWSAVTVPGATLYAVENPAVFEELVDSGGPPLICTSGFLSVAAVRMLDLAVQSGVRLAYGGDFDLKGLTIAAGLWKRYGSHITMWGMAPEDYRLAAQHHLAEDLAPADVSKLKDLAVGPLVPLVAAMEQVGKRAYQEALIPMLRAETGGPLRES